LPLCSTSQSHGLQIGTLPRSLSTALEAWSFHSSRT
jgi:hypothetical protein